MIQIESMDGVFLTDFNSGKPFLHQRGLGAYHMASVLRMKGLEIFVLDMIFSFSTNEIQILVNKLISIKTKFIGLSTTFMAYRINELGFNQSSTTDPLTTFITLARRVNPKIEIYQGGGFHFKPHHLVNHWIPGQYVENLFLSKLSERNNLSLTADFDFVSHNFSFHKSDLILDRETLPLEISRGCIFSCKFCSFSGRGKKINSNLKKLEHTQSFLQSSYDLYRTENFYLADDTFNESESKLQNFYNMIQQLTYKPKFCAYIRIDLLVRFPNMISILYECGVRGISFGIETLHPEAAKAIGKSISFHDLTKTLETIKNKYPDIILSSGFIAGLPFEPISSIYKTHEFLLSSRLLDSWRFAPLILDNERINPNPSYFSENIESFNYQRVGPFGWDRGDLTYLEAEIVCNNLNLDKQNQVTPSPWVMFGFLRNYSFKEISGIKFSDMNNYGDLNKFSEYKSKLFQLLGVSY